jgi:hypothetical protein
MAVRDLAPALLSLGDVFTDASLLLYPDNDPVSLEIEATGEGSFEINLILQTASDVWDQLSGLGAADSVTSLIVLRELVVGASADTSLFGFLKWLRGRGVAEREQTPDPGRIRLTTEDGSSLEVPSEVAQMYDNVRIRRKVREVVHPLHRRGVSRVEFESEDEVTLSIDENDLEGFDAPALDDKTLSDQEIDLMLLVVSPAFKEDNKWRFNDGQADFYAPILDGEFLARVEAGEPFRKGDRLRAKVQLIQLEEDGTLRTERRLVEVYDHIPAHTQLRLDDPKRNELPPSDEPAA